MRFREQYTNQQVGVQYSTGAPFPMSMTSDYIKEEMLAGDHGNYGFPDFPGLGGVGGSFYLRKTEWHVPLIDVGEIYAGGPNNYSYKGKMGPGLAAALGFVTNSYTPDSYGAQAYNRMKPTAPDFNMGNFVYELRELPGQLQQRFLDPKNPLKSISNYWLALKFGWEPLLRDLRDMYVLQRTIEKRLAQLLRDNGRPVRRRVTIYDTTSPVVVNTRSDIVQTFIPGLITQYYSGPYSQTTRQWNFDRIWSSARFRYWLPDGPRDMNWRRAVVARLFGALPTPSVLWNALPWTWLIDWFGGVGDVLENMESGVANRCAADYFYMMRQIGGRFETESSVGFKRRSGERVTFSGTSYSQWTHKCRSIGDPFGFNTQLPLSGMQLSILGALGMSRLR